MASRNYKYYQPNEKDLKDEYGDCVVRALTKVTGKTCRQVFDELLPYWCIWIRLAYCTV